MTKEQRKKHKVKVYTNKQKPSKPEIEYIQELQAKYNEKVDLTKIKSFKDFPLSFKTLKGLKNAGYKVPTEIQKETIMLALRGNDILGAAQTGSGKTLAFLIPMLEKLFCKQWTHLDGLGALVITPTRELALQIFETLKKIGVNHDFSCGLIIGGKDLKFESKRMDQCNIIICTPGRLLQHMDENPLFDACNLQILILDEADRCMDMGFKATMNAIIANLPLERQTLLFSATQTKSVKDLARLNLKDPSYVAVHEHAQHSTPDTLEQSYVVCELKDKVAILWSFIKNHLKKKCIIFLSTCKQVKFIFEIFSKMRPGVPLMALYSRMHQMRRIKIYEEFSKRSSAILFATDIVARGLDFPEVHWVVQVDCPEDADTYIHRVGRTARFHKGGESLLMLMPSELEMLEELKKKKIPINKIEINPTKLNDPFRKMETFVVGNTALQYTAKRAFVTYLKSIYMMKKRRDIFNIEALDYDSFAHSYGLTETPRLSFLKAKKNKTDKTTATNPNKIVFDDDGNPVGGNNKKQQSESDSETEGEEQTDNGNGNSQLIFFETNKDVPVPEEVILKDFEVVATKKKPTTKAAIAKKLLSKKAVTNKKIKFDEEGDPVGKDQKSDQSYCTGEGLDLDKLEVAFKEMDDSNKQVYREKVKAKHKEQKRKLKEQKKKEREEQIDDFGDSESEEEVDLSWIPDPKKIYGDGEEDKEENDEDNLGHSEEETEVAEEEVTKSIEVSKPKKKKRKLEEQPEDVPKKKHKKMDSFKQMTSELSVNEAEELALMLLQK
ncbi:probable ATP-dependent RNA helicase DDX10 [Coccinella septempunctata]|uniref:probable ATP-dependent RNA helicase DDX10 n=1 Tax=Coccinella septempunctata TaxID=41139 RepID=UPI001D0924E1|nr:probable ATP-dependent RNA helicase DDX10 [Coccinella septempunctata]